MRSGRSVTSRDRTARCEWRTSMVPAGALGDPDHAVGGGTPFDEVWAGGTIEPVSHGPGDSVWIFVDPPGTDLFDQKLEAFSLFNRHDCSATSTAILRRSSFRSSPATRSADFEDTDSVVRRACSPGRSSSHTVRAAGHRIAVHHRDALHALGGGAPLAGHGRLHDLVTVRRRPGCGQNCRSRRLHGVGRCHRHDGRCVRRLDVGGVISGMVPCCRPGRRVDRRRCHVPRSPAIPPVARTSTSTRCRRCDCSTRGPTTTGPDPRDQEPDRGR